MRVKTRCICSTASMSQLSNHDINDTVSHLYQMGRTETVLGLAANSRRSAGAVHDRPAAGNDFSCIEPLCFFCFANSSMGLGRTCSALSRFRHLRSLRVDRPVRREHDLSQPEGKVGRLCIFQIHLHRYVLSWLHFLIGIHSACSILP